MGVHRADGADPLHRPHPVAVAGKASLEVRAYRGDLDALARTLERMADPQRVEVFSLTAQAVAVEAARTARAAAQAEPDALTRAIIRSAPPTVDPPRASGGLAWVDVRMGGPAQVAASGRPLAGQVLFGAEFGGQRRAYRQDTTGRGRKRGRLQGYTVVRSRGRGSRNAVHRLSATEQRALLNRGGRSLKRTTQQFRPYRARGYWLFPTLAAAQDELLELWERAYDDLGDLWSGRG